MRKILACTVLALVLAPSVARATDYYVDPASGSGTNSGSSASPWHTLEEVVQAGLIGTTVVGGDTVFLRSGYHGELVIGSGSFAVPITFEAEAGQKPELSRVQFRNASGFTVRGLSISPSYAPVYAQGTMVDLQSTSSKITVENCGAFSVADASSWTETDWMNQASNGAQVSGDDLTLRGNRFKNVRFGISVGGARALIARNTVENFSADGLRGLGNYGVFEYNLVKNVYVGDPPDGNHDDGFQSWSVGPGGVGTGEVIGVVLRGNTIINYTDPNQPFRTTLQGIGCFDGTFVDWVVENNVVITDHWHGITFLGARNVRIVNNTVIDPNTQTPGPPWIQIGNHKDGTPPENCVVRNNLVTDLNLASSGVTEDHNIVLGDLTQFFVNAAAYDLHLLQSAPAVNAGSADLAPNIDIEGVPRPQGSGIDVGAYEWHDSSVMVDAGVGGSGGTGSSAGGASAGGMSLGGASNAAGGGFNASGTGGSSDAGLTSATSSEKGGCSCRTARASRNRLALAALVFGLGLLFARRVRPAASLGS